MLTDTDIIHTYTVRQALEDEALVDPCARLGEDMARQIGLPIPVFFTVGVWADLVKVPEVAPSQSEAGRAWDIFTMLRWSILLTRNANERWRVRVSATHADAPDWRPTDHRLLAEAGEDPEIGGYITVMWPSER